MKIKDILKVKGTRVWTVRENQSIREALEILVKQNIGALLVCDEMQQQILGIISERDIVRGCYSARKNLDVALVREWMTRRIVTCSPEDEIAEIMSVMTTRRIRHIPVVVGSEIQGVVSIGDIVKSLLQDSEDQIQFLKEYIYGPDRAGR